MKSLKTLLILLLVLTEAGFGWVMMNFYVVGFQLYPKDAVSLDLRGRDISLSDYEALTEKLPTTQIRWDVPFQGGLLPDDTRELTLTRLSDRDLTALACLENLKTVNALECDDYDQLVELARLRPDVEVNYYVPIGGLRYHQDTARIQVTAITAQEIGLLKYLPNLDTVILRGGSKIQDLMGLIDYCEARDLACLAWLGGQNVPWNVKNLEVENITDEDLTLLPNLTKLRKLHLRNPKAEPENIFSLQESIPKVKLSWDVEIAGEIFTRSTLEMDLTQLVIEDVALLEERCSYLPDLQSVTLGLCGLDDPKWENSKVRDLAVSPVENQDLADFRDRVRDRVKVVWTVRLGPSIALRTDADNFMPNHFGVGQLPDNYAYNLRYCEDMVCLDVGHMTLTDISFVEYMPKLKYLILAWTEVQYIEPIRSCKNLIWLELDNSCIRDLSPLVDCTALEDLNIGNTFCDITPVLEMTWLKNLYMIKGNGGHAWLASQALPDTYVCASGDATVGGGWRRLPNYYAMRDMLHMYYMN